MNHCMSPRSDTFSKNMNIREIWVVEMCINGSPRTLPIDLNYSKNTFIIEQI